MRTGYYAGLLVGFKIKLSVVMKVLNYDDPDDNEPQMKKLARKLKCRAYLFGNLLGGLPSEQWVAFHPRMPKKAEGQKNCHSLSVEGFYSYYDIVDYKFLAELLLLKTRLERLGFEPGNPLIGTSWDAGL